MITLLLIIAVYLISVFITCSIYSEKDIPIESFWAWIIMLVPIVNTIFCIRYIKYCGINITYSYKDFIEKLKE